VSRFLTVEDWITQRLPAFLDGNPLNAIFVSYNSVGDFKPGQQETRKSGLKVIVQNGYVDPSPFALGLLLSGDFSLMRLGAQTMDDAANAAQQAAEKGLDAILPTVVEQSNVLLVIYAGLSAFRASVDYARSFRQKISAAKITVLTCDCNLRMKSDTLLPLQQSGEINDVVVTPDCGGRYQMAKMLQALIDSWPAAVPIA